MGPHPLLLGPPHSATILLPGLMLAAAGTLLAGCAMGQPHYQRIDDNLRAGRFQQADAIVAEAEDDYGAKSRVLYGMDRGILLQLLGQYEASTKVLTAAEEEVEHLYTRKMRNEALAFLLNDNELPFEGVPFEQVMINVLKTVNFALQQNWQEALVEARRLDHRLNVIADRTPDKDGYRDDGFARYLTGILYEISGDLNNALVAYRRAYEAYRTNHSWSRVGVPGSLRADLLRVSEAVGLTTELQEYRQAFPEMTWQPWSAQRQFAQVIVISYNGRAPARVDHYLDVPLGLEAARLVLLSRGFGGGRAGTRTADSLLYGLNGKVVRIALPRLIPQPSAIAYSQLSLSGPQGTFTGRTEPMHSITGHSEKALADRLPGLAVRAAARAAVKYGLAETAERGIRSASRRQDGSRNDLEWVAFVAGALLKTAAIATEESDKRSWRTLPDEIQVARIWVPAGEYNLHLEPVGRHRGLLRSEQATHHVMLHEGETRFIVERLIQ